MCVCVCVCVSLSVFCCCLFGKTFMTVNSVDPDLRRLIWVYTVCLDVSLIWVRVLNAKDRL